MIALLMTEIFNFLSFGKKIEVSIIENFGNLKNKHIFSEDNEKKNYSFLLFTKKKKNPLKNPLKNFIKIIYRSNKV